MSLAIQNVLSNYHDARMDMHGAPLFLGYIGLSFSIATLLEREKTERTFLYTRFIKWRKIFFIGSPIQSLYLFDYSLHYVCNLPILMRSSSSFFPWLMTRVIYPPFSMQYFIGCPLFFRWPFFLSIEGFLHGNNPFAIGKHGIRRNSGTIKKKKQQYLSGKRDGCFNEYFVDSIILPNRKAEIIQPIMNIDVGQPNSPIQINTT